MTLTFEFQDTSLGPGRRLGRGCGGLGGDRRAAGVSPGPSCDEHRPDAGNGADTGNSGTHDTNNDLWAHTG